MAPLPRFFLLLLLHLFFIKTHSTLIMVTLSPNKSLSDGDVLISAGKRFALGFFSPGNSTRRYLGIWYYQVSEPTIVWVANRDKPLMNTTGVVVFDPAGNLRVGSKNDPSRYPFWSTNLSENTSAAEAKLLDTGNLVVVQESTGNFLWQSFNYPTDTLMPFMKLGLDRRTGLDRFLTSWKSKYDPGIGSCTYRFNPTGIPQVFTYKGSTPWWRAGSWNGLRLSGVPEMTKSFIFNLSYLDNPDELSIMYGILNPSIDSRMILEGDSCTVQRLTWHESEKRWTGFWSAPKDTCDKYEQCGNFGYCDPNKNPAEFECNCLPGFRPWSNQDWYLRDGSDGCVRVNGPESACGKGEGFVKMERVKVPDTSMARVDMAMDIEACRKMCARNCSCVAYTSANVSNGGSGCLAWYRDLIDIKVYSNVGQTLFVRVDSVTLGDSRKRSKGLHGTKKILVVIVVPVVFTVLLLVMIFICFSKKHGLLGGNARWRSHRSLLGLASGDNNDGNENEGDDRSISLPFFSFREIKNATKNFSYILGEGGFGVVYMGNLPNQQEIAVKRLSKHSGQGAEEFKNEVLLIAKLQHRNLVKILGCCIDGDETMLIYEYMPNKSLDAFLFDQSLKASLDWKTRYGIILGVARGILYLHEDSRLRIVHRDLKASNILLDKDMNPKISDFGMARIFGGNQTQANTNRVVGTFGYMSPEYALDGLFSMKSDVFSYGVLLLEIVSGKKNLALYSDDPFSNLIRCIWDLWKEGRGLEIVDESMGGCWSEFEVLRCLHVGLLCVQDIATDRPTMSAVGFMLTNETNLPSPKQPSFALRRTGKDMDASGSTSSCSKNEITLSAVYPR